MDSWLFRTWWRRPKSAPPPPAATMPTIVQPATPDPQPLPPITALEEIMPPRLTHCPETGISLEGRKLRTYAENMWPAKALDVNNPHCAEAIRRKALVMEEAELRDMDDKRKPSGTATASGAEKGKA